jgi:hypothetical protein
MTSSDDVRSSDDVSGLAAGDGEFAGSSDEPRPAASQDRAMSAAASALFNNLRPHFDDEEIELLTLKLAFGLSAKEIAACRGCSEGRVNRVLSRLHRLNEELVRQAMRKAGFLEADIELAVQLARELLLSRQVMSRQDRDRDERIAEGEPLSGYRPPPRYLRRLAQRLGKAKSPSRKVPTGDVLARLVERLAGRLTALFLRSEWPEVVGSPLAEGLRQLKSRLQEHLAEDPDWLAHRLRRNGHPPQAGIIYIKLKSGRRLNTVLRDLKKHAPVGKTTKYAQDLLTRYLSLAIECAGASKAHLPPDVQSFYDHFRAKDA